MFKQKSDPGAGSAKVEPADAVQQARTRARQRLIGAVVLLVIGVIGFPLVFETQPRPIPVDIPIEIPKRDAMPPLAMPSAPVAPVAPAEEPRSAVVAAAPSPASVPAPKPAPRNGGDVITESRGDAGRDVTPPAPASAPARPVSRPETAATTRPAADGERARALLEGRSAEASTANASSSAATRFVLQVGAFADAESARESRKQVEKLGLKTYTQVAQTPGGSRIRVRVGPFASRPEAEQALAKVKAAGHAAVVLTL